MRNRFPMLCVAALSAGAMVAGCGGSSSSSSKSSSSSAAAPAAPAAASSINSSSGGGSVASNPAVQQAVAACKASINSSPSLSATVKSKLVGLCDKAASGDPTAIRKASAQVCAEIVKATVPSSAQAAALASCPKT